MIPLPSEGKFGHTWVGNQVRDGQGGDMEKMFEDAIGSILKGEAPKIWNDDNIRAYNKYYAKTINQERDLIKIFLAKYI